MERDDFETAVEDYAERIPAFRSQPRDPATTDGEISAFAEKYSFDPPEDYCWFVKRYGSGLFGTAGILSLSEDGLEQIVEFSSTIEPSLGEFFPVINLTTGDYYGYRNLASLSDAVGRRQIFYYDHELAQVSSAKFDNLFDCIVERFLPS